VGSQPIKARFDVQTVQQFAREGKLEEWVHTYLNAGHWANPGFSDGLKLQERWWIGPIEMELTALSRAVGPEAGMEYQVDKDSWHRRIDKMAQSMTDPLAIPPLIVEYRSGELSVRDGNTRHGAMSLRGWSACWVLIWYNSEEDYLHHRAQLLPAMRIGAQ
jgi:hypothetical protein